MSTIVKEEKAHKLSDLINYYETCNRAEGKSLRTTVIRGFLRNKHPSGEMSGLLTACRV